MIYLLYDMHIMNRLTDVSSIYFKRKHFFKIPCYSIASFSRTTWPANLPFSCGPCTYGGCTYLIQLHYLKVLLFLTYFPCMQHFLHVFQHKISFNTILVYFVANSYWYILINQCLFKFYYNVLEDECILGKCL